jgi:hypothetical protein
VGLIQQVGYPPYPSHLPLGSHPLTSVSEGMITVD